MYSIVPAGDSAFIIKAGDAITSEINDSIHALYATINDATIPGIIECIPAYSELTVCYDPCVTDYTSLVAQLKQCTASVHLTAPRTGMRIFIPVAYGGEYGPDLAEVADCHTMSPDEVITAHTKNEYRVYMLGFTPGFPYLGGLDTTIATPRRATPRTLIPAGSVGIADTQTGIYPIESPGGWNLIGRTPLSLFNPHQNEPFLINAGDTLCFYAIDAHEFEQLHDAVQRGTFVVKKESITI